LLKNLCLSSVLSGDLSGAALAKTEVGTKTGALALADGWLCIREIREIRGAAHKAARAAGESPVRDETNVPVVITDLWVERSRTGKLGSKRPVQSGASKMAGRNIK